MHIIVYINFVTHHPCQVAIISGGFLSLGRALQLVIYIQRELLVYSKRFPLQFVFAFTRTYATMVEKASNDRFVSRIAFFTRMFSFSGFLTKTVDTTEFYTMFKENNIPNCYGTYLLPNYCFPFILFCTSGLSTVDMYLRFLIFQIESINMSFIAVYSFYFT